MMGLGKGNGTLSKLQFLGIYVRFMGCIPFKVNVSKTPMFFNSFVDIDPPIVRERMHSQFQFQYVCIPKNNGIPKSSHFNRIWNHEIFTIHFGGTNSP